MDLTALPGGDLVQKGLSDVAAGVESDESLLVAIGRPRLQTLGFDAPETVDQPEMRLYLRLALTDSDSAHSRYNALVRRLVSFENAAACVK